MHVVANKNVGMLVVALAFSWAFTAKSCTYITHTHPYTHTHSKSQHSITGNGLINEAEFLQWVGRIQALRDDQQPHDDSASTASKPVDEADDVTEDLIAAFR